MTTSGGSPQVAVVTGGASGIGRAVVEELTGRGWDVASLDLTVELITHRFTETSKDTLLRWYPNTKLDLDESNRTVKRTKFGGVKYVYPAETMREMRTWFERALGERLPEARLLYWT